MEFLKLSPQLEKAVELSPFVIVQILVEEALPMRVLAGNPAVLGLDVGLFGPGKTAPFGDNLPKEELPRLAADFARLKKDISISSFNVEYTFLNRFGGITKVTATGGVERLPGGEPISVICAIMRKPEEDDLLEEQRLKDSIMLLRANKIFESVINNFDEAVFVMDFKNYEILFSNSKFDELTKARAPGRKCWELLGDDSQNKCEECALGNLFDNARAGEVVVRERYLEKFDTWFEITDTLIDWHDGRMVRLQALRDINDKKLDDMRIQRILNTDALLGIPNRFSCENTLNLLLSDAKNEGSAVYIDLDNFRQINDAWGREAGDELLRQISDYLQELLGFGEERLFRIGGDEFLVLLDGFAPQETMEFATRLLTRFREPWSIENNEELCTVSIGVASFPADGGTADEIIQKAEIAMSLAKNEGKDGLCYYHRAIDEKLRDEVVFERRLKLAVSNGCENFSLSFLPVIDVGNRRIEGAEALVRWNDSKLGLQMPNDFLHVAEKTGLIIPLGKWIIAETCRLVKEMQQKIEKFVISINISKRQFLSGGFFAYVHSVIEQTGVSPGIIIFEIDGDFAGGELSQAINVCENLRAIGVRIALDNFGSDNSTIGNLRKLPIDIIKVDRHYIQTAEGDRFSRPFVAAMLEIARQSGIILCAEGVETRRQFAMVSEMRSVFAEGFYFARPMPAEQFCDWAQEADIEAMLA